jgi:hypothetical protein
LLTVLAWIGANGLSAVVLILLLIDPGRPLGPIVALLAVAVVAWVFLVGLRRTWEPGVNDRVWVAAGVAGLVVMVLALCWLMW